MKPHVLVARLDSDGDVLLAGPAVRAVASHAGRVTLLCTPPGRRAAELLPDVDGIHVMRAGWIEADAPPVHRDDLLRLVDDVRRLGVDEAIILTSFHQSPLPLALLLRMAGVPRTGAICEDFPGSLLDLRHRVPDDIHEVQRALSLVAALGYPLSVGDPDTLRIRRPAAGHVAPPLPRPFLVVHPGCTVPARAWSESRNRDLVRALARDGQRVVVTGAPSEKALTARVAGAHPRVADLGGKTTLAELAEIISMAEAIVVGNTGPAHLAAAVGTPVVSLFPPTVPAVRWRPWKVRQVLLGQQDISCAGCRSRVCPIPGQPCLGSVQVQDVLDALESLRASRLAAAAEEPAVTGRALEGGTAS